MYYGVFYHFNISKMVGSLLPEVENWTCDLCDRRLTADGTPVAKNLRMTP